MTQRVIRLLCDAQNYPWGKVGTDSIISQMGPEASGKDWKFSETTPYAELWMTTHPNLPSRLYESPSTTLSSHLDAHPELLGIVPQKFPKPVEGKNEKHVPFLFKILTCKQALPLQIHPDKKLAAELHARDPSKFVDANHKPEIACALTPFLGFAGFAPFDRIATNISTIPELRDFLQPLPSYQLFLDDRLNSSKLKALVKDILLLNPKSSGILESAKDVLKTLTGTQDPPMERGGGDAQGVIRSLIDRVEQHGPEAVFAGTMWNDDQKQRISAALRKTQEFYAGDPGIIVACFFMNLIELQPGEAMYVQEDGLHAWLDGQIIELMANSDDVLNAAFIEGGEKDDINIFIDTMTCDPRPAETYKLERHNWALSRGAGATVYQVPAEEFSLFHIVGTDASTTVAPLNGPAIAIVTAVSSSGSQITDKTCGTMINVKKGQVYFVGAGTEIEYGPGVEVWAAFYDDQNRGQTGNMK
ncbi:hypothetical protein NliqN6_0498 [Naganishia liquefaciens]|uniref:Mannose-6-phosphate isomerase n=1 Tax=Naganishia liquefaciens TaxID=104408 RepID=A0A8H3TNP3_9TREE|nr:hypothetical protein NliqN6_0498 [Naganishia liquefaciens]